jgi:hypothetical protein
MPLPEILIGSSALSFRLHHMVILKETILLNQGKIYFWINHSVPVKSMGPALMKRRLKISSDEAARNLIMPF